MKATWIRRNNNKSVLLFFNGWGMDEQIAHYLYDQDTTALPYDILHFHDYRDTAIADDVRKQLDTYDERILIAWSMGVWAASRAGLKNISRAIAINGTLYPINTFKGIEPTIFQATLDGYGEETRTRFMRRICGGSSGLKKFAVMAPQRSTSDQHDEMAAIQKQVLSAYPVDMSWRYQHAIIGGKDLIFTDPNQKRAWANITQTHIDDMPHVPFFKFNSWQEILSCLD